MKLVIPGKEGLTLEMKDDLSPGPIFPTDSIKKGLQLRVVNIPLIEEGVGFGVPLVKQQFHTIFPGEVKLNQTSENGEPEINATYTLNMEEKLESQKKGIVNRAYLYRIKNRLANWIRNYPRMRHGLSWLSQRLRAINRWKTVYTAGNSSYFVDVTYKVMLDSEDIQIQLDFSRLDDGRLTELVIMNEMGGNYFDQYRDSRGCQLSGADIGVWQKITERKAGFFSTQHQVGFVMSQCPPADLYFGREIVPGQLAWSGFGYVLKPPITNFKYTIRLSVGYERYLTDLSLL